MAFFLLLPFFLIRFGLLYLLDHTAIRRAALFAPLAGGEKAAYWIYQISNAAIVVCLCFLNIQLAPSICLFLGAAVYVLGLALLIASVVSFAKPASNRMNKTGLYKYSRNPMYVAYFIFFTGCALLTQSMVLLALILVFQFSAHWIIRSEERWCLQKFGGAYRAYMEKVRRYL